MPTPRRRRLWVVSTALILALLVASATAGCETKWSGTPGAVAQGQSCNLYIPPPYIDSATLPGGIVYKAYSVCANAPIRATLSVQLWYATAEYPKLFFRDDSDLNQGIPTADLQTTPAFGQVSMPCTAGYSYKVVVRVTVVYSVGGKAESAARKVTSPTTKIPPTLGGRYNSCQEAPPRHH